MGVSFAHLKKFMRTIPGIARMHFLASAPEGAAVYNNVTASLKRCPDTNRSWYELVRDTS
jgi:hypothetical protein